MLAMRIHVYGKKLDLVNQKYFASAFAPLFF